MSKVPLDLTGNISLALQVVILFLLFLGLPVFRDSKGKKNLIAHGYSTIVAVVLHTVLIFLVMVPVFTSGLGEISGLSTLALFTVISHIILGITAEALGVIIVAFSLGKSIGKMACWRLHRWMIPTFVIWAISIVNGAIVHIFGLL